MDGLPELRNLSINTFYETFAPMNTAEDMENYLATSFDEAKFRKTRLQKKRSSYLLPLK